MTLGNLSRSMTSSLVRGPPKRTLFGNKPVRNSAVQKWSNNEHSWPKFGRKWEQTSLPVTLGQKTEGSACQDTVVVKRGLSENPNLLEKCAIQTIVYNKLRFSLSILIKLECFSNKHCCRCYKQVSLYYT